MQRRDFIKLAGGAALIPIAPSVFGGQINHSKWNSYRLTYQINLPTKGKRALLWLPLPIQLIHITSLLKEACGTEMLEKLSFIIFPKQVSQFFMLNGEVAAHGR